MQPKRLVRRLDTDIDMAIELGEELGDLTALWVKSTSCLQGVVYG